jgi:hypothetical protein
VDNYRLTKRSSNRAAVKAYIKAQVLRASTQHAAVPAGNTLVLETLRRVDGCQPMQPLIDVSPSIQRLDVHS